LLFRNDPAAAADLRERMVALLTLPARKVRAPEKVAAGKRAIAFGKAGEQRVADSFAERLASAGIPLTALLGSTHSALHRTEGSVTVANQM
jgi:hypothetical protein